ncbi:MAG: type III-B CRISPR module-associated protein Cmr5 [Fimbriimonadales bacterium]|nr:type III-B CRISPR module-associated protein Cmr5 [Fimbriimonadales bacterium]
MTPTRAQQAMQHAMQLVQQVAQCDKKVQEIYGGLCHDFPVLARTCGLCQAVAFSADKAQSDEKARAEAHQLLLKHVGKILGIETDGKGGANDPLLQEIIKADALQYMLYTRQVLHAWVYFKRFAVSILGVKTGGQRE